MLRLYTNPMSDSAAMAPNTSEIKMIARRLWRIRASWSATLLSDFGLRSGAAMIHSRVLLLANNDSTGILCIVTPQRAFATEIILVTGLCIHRRAGQRKHQYH